MATVEGAVNEVLQQFGDLPAGTPPGAELLRSTQVTLQFLEVCSRFKDNEFADVARGRAKELQDALKAASMGAAATPAKDTTKARAKTKTKGKTKGKTKEKAKAAGGEEDVGESSAVFNAKVLDAFTDALGRFMRARLAPFQITKPLPVTPFFLSPAFARDFETAIRQHLVPGMADTRRVKVLLQGLNVMTLTEETFTEIFTRDEKDNIVRWEWQSRLTSYREILLSEARAQAASKKSGTPDEKKGFLARIGLDIFGGGAKKKVDSNPAARAGAARDKLIQDAHGFWSVLRKGAKEAGYDPPKPADIVIFESLFDFVPGRINTAMGALEQLLRQETSAYEEGRDGSSRQYMNQVIRTFPDYCGEMVAVWAYFSQKEFFAERILKSFLASMGTTPKERKRQLPLFLRWVPDVVAKSGSTTNI